jgi:hypothetical protein
MYDDSQSKRFPTMFRRNGLKVPVRVLCNLLAVSIIVIVCLLVSRQFREGDRRTALLRSITADMIGGIEVYENAYSSRRMDIKAVNSPSSKALFANAMHDLSDYEANRDPRAQDFFIQMQTVDGLTHQFEVWLKPDVQDMAFMFMVERSLVEGRIHDKHLGTRKSSDLFKWLKHHQLVK